VQGLVEFVKTLGAARIGAMAAVTVALVGFFAFLIVRVTAPQMAPLFMDLSLDDSSAVVKELERQVIPYELKNDGAIILVPSDRVARIRMKLADSGLPKGGGVGYDIFDKSDVLGTTSFVQNINHLRALEGELARTIRALDRVQAARVHLVLPERPLFSRDKVEPSASIVLKVRGTLDPSQVRAVRHLVASAVNGLKPERISIVDEAGRLLADGAASGEDGAGLGADERKIAFERQLRDRVEAIVSSVVGSGRARVQLTADFDFNRITQTSDRYDPEGRVLRSSQTREETSMSGNSNGQVSVGTELPNANQRPGGAAPPEPASAPQDQTKKSEEISNWDISRTTRTEIIEGGRVNRVSVAVLVDGVYAKNDKGDMVYQPREKEEIDRIAALVRSAIGFDQRRGDQVEVVNLRFAEAPTVPISEPSGGWLSFITFTKDDIMRVLELAVMAVLGLVVMLLVVRPLVRRIVTPDAPKPGDMALAAALAGDVPAALAAGASAEEIKAVPSATAKMIDIAQVQGQVHALSVQKVGELADRNPHETVSIIRSWLHESE